MAWRRPLALLVGREGYGAHVVVETVEHLVLLRFRLTQDFLEALTRASLAHVSIDAAERLYSTLA